MVGISNKIVFITGASSGIGEACGKLFAQHSAKVILCARREEKLKTLAEQLRDKTEVLTLTLDITDKKAVAETISALPKAWQAIDILINNAGLALSMDKLAEGKLEDWDRMIDTNVKGLLYITRALIPEMLQRNQGHIISIGSLAGHDVYVGGSVYCATKFAVNGLTKALRKDLMGTDLRVSSIDPGAVETDFSNVRFKGNKARARKVYEGFTPLTAEDVADAVYYCASRPAHVNIQEIILTPTAQASINKIYRKTDK